MLQRRRLVTPNPVTPPGTRDSLVATGQVSARARAQRRVRRPQELLDALAALDTTADEVVRKQLMDWIQQVYEERGGGQLLGLFAKCYLGHPYVDHRLSLDGAIAEHYSASDPVPAAFVPCRGLARSTAYAYVEVYSDGQVVPIRLDGDAAL